MTALSHPYSFVAGTTATAAEVNSNFASTRSIVNGQLADDNFAATAGMYTAYKTIHEAQHLLMDAHTAGTYIPVGNGGSVLAATNQPLVPTAFRLEAADYPISGRATKLRLRAQLMVNATAPAITFTAGLHAVSSVAGTADNLNVTVAAAISGSTVPFATPSASTFPEGDSSDFTIPADGTYILAVVTNGTVAASSIVGINLLLQQHWI